MAKEALFSAQRRYVLDLVVPEPVYSVEGSMTKITTTLVLSVLAVGCANRDGDKGTAGEKDPLVAEFVALADAVCVCKDKECAAAEVSARKENKAFHTPGKDIPRSQQKAIER